MAWRNILTSLSYLGFYEKCIYITCGINFFHSPVKLSYIEIFASDKKGSVLNQLAEIKRKFIKFT